MALVPRQRLLFCHTATSESLLICSCVSTSAAITEELPASCSTPRALIPTRIRRSEAGRDGRPQSGGRAGSRACGQLRMGGDPGVCGGGRAAGVTGHVFVPRPSRQPQFPRSGVEGGFRVRV